MKSNPKFIGSGYMPDNSKDDFYPSSIYGEKLIEVQNISWLHPEHPWHHQFCILQENIEDVNSGVLNSFHDALEQVKQAGRDISDTVKLPAEFLPYSTYKNKIPNRRYSKYRKYRKHTRYK